MANFSADGKRRIAKSVRRLEQTPRSRPRPPAHVRIVAGGKYAITTGTISAAVRATATFGKGPATLQVANYNPTTDVGTYASMALGFDVVIYSGALATIAAGRLVLLQFVDGRYHIVSDYC